MMDTSNMVPGGASEARGGWGPVFGIVIIIAIIVFGGVYFLSKRSSGGYNAQAPAGEAATATASVSDIESSLNSTDTTNLGSELKAVDANLNGQ